MKGGGGGEQGLDRREGSEISSSFLLTERRSGEKVDDVCPLCVSSGFRSF